MECHTTDLGFQLCTKSLPPQTPVFPVTTERLQVNNIYKGGYV